MISAELLKKIQKFHFKTRFMANDLYAGQYESAFKGQGIEFAEKLMSFVQRNAHTASSKLADIRGPFPNWSQSIWRTRKNKNYC